MAVQRAWEVLQKSLLLLLVLVQGLQACGRVAIESPVVHFGSSVTATCTIHPKNCSTVGKNDLSIQWTLDGHDIPTTQSVSVQMTQSNVTIKSFNRPRGNLSCYATGNGTRQLLDRVQIDAGYPPSKPSGLLCVMNVTDDSLTCTWNPGRDTYLNTSVTLERYRNLGRCGHLQEKKEDCIPKKGRNSCTIPRKFLNLYQKVDLWVTAQNALGRVESEHLCLDPMEVVKLNPPTIQKIRAIPFHPDCLSLEWAKPVDGSWIKQQFELRYRLAEDTEWHTVVNITHPALQMEHCGLHLSQDYLFQMRCIKAPLKGYWSEWSDTMRFLMPEGAPTERPDVWWKSEDVDSESGGMKVQLLWKAMQKGHTRGSIFRYLVFYEDESTTEGQKVLCNTTEHQCHVLLPFGVPRIYVQACNAAGHSPATEVTLLSREGRSLPRVQAFPNDDHSLWVEWDVSKDSVRGYVLEWCKVVDTGTCDIHWKLESNASSRSLLQENIEPFTLYRISLYPLYKDAVGLPVQTEAYSREKAPSRTPKLQLKSVGRSWAMLSWEPVTVEERNGFITNYTIFWKESQEKIIGSMVEASTRSFIIENLESLRTYEVHLMSSTNAGSTNGTSLSFKTGMLNDLEVNLLCVACALALFMFMIVYMKKHQVKNRLWPNVPDPANSSSGKWIPAELQEVNKLPYDMREPQHVMTCDVTILEKDIAAEKNRSMDNLQDHLKSFLQEHDGTKLGSQRPNSDTSLRSYVNTSESVQYAKVIVDSYRGQRAPAPLYLRSESTQPLLGDMTPSPKPYENLWFRGNHSGGSSPPGFQEDETFHESNSLMDFPLLQGLKIEGTDGLCDFKSLLPSRM
ncbi:granulocyte colony-stimulating factor receptor [Ambystoma mexicanum]|uniref:granulocyte colony-stimulating factor receptor n=1 Tax=Ambystoma mexicanum TaxID=8296 RepID=UPI0037E75926